MPDPRALADRLGGIDPRAYHVVTLPDFFLDHILHVPAWSQSTAAWRAVHERGGGNVATPGQHLAPGGNAANTALALARLGVRTHLVARTSQLGRTYLDATLGRMGVDLHHVKADGELAVTTAIEFQEERPVNVMLSHPGSVAEFGPDSLDANDWTLVEAADLVLVTNWTQNRRGTDLVESVARVARKAGRRTMLDTGDPSVHAGGAADLAARLLPLGALDIYALNENELCHLAGRALATPAEQLAAARHLAGLRAGGTLDLHTSGYAASFGPFGAALAPTFPVDVQRVTGAGDAWNAGNILGHLAGLAAEDRLLLANAVGALYVSASGGPPPTLHDTVAFLRDGPTLRQG